MWLLVVEIQPLMRNIHVNKAGGVVAMLIVVERLHRIYAYRILTGCIYSKPDVVSTRAQILLPTCNARSSESLVVWTRTGWCFQ